MKPAKYQGNKKESLVPVSRASSPFWPLLRWQREIYRLFGDPFMNWLMPEEAFVEDWMPAINVYEGKDNLVIEAVGTVATITIAGTNPMLTSGNPNFADSAARTTSQANASPHPPPSALPRTAAITGLGWSRND